MRYWERSLEPVSSDSLVSYPVMAFIMGRDGLNAFYLHPDVYLSNDHGWRSSICVPESTEPKQDCWQNFREVLEQKFMIKQLENQLKSVRDATKREQPLVHCITNPISIHGCANMIIAVGARPMMAEHPMEVEGITKTAGALMLNLGNITDARIESMKRSARTAAKEGIPVLLDLVGVSCSKIRMELAMELIEKGKMQILKGNISELLAIAGQPFHGTGIDAGAEDAMTGDNEEERKEIFRKVSKKTGSVLLATGAKDLLVDQNRCLILENGVPELSGITGTGCMVGGTFGGFPGAERSVCGGIAWDFGDGNRRGDRRKEVNSDREVFSMELLDAVAGLTQEELEARIRIRGDWNIKWS